MPAFAPPAPGAESQAAPQAADEDEAAIWEGGCADLWQEIWLALGASLPGFPAPPAEGCADLEAACARAAASVRALHAAGVLDGACLRGRGLARRWSVLRALAGGDRGGRGWGERLGGVAEAAAWDLCLRLPGATPDAIAPLAARPEAPLALRHLARDLSAYARLASAGSRVCAGAHAAAMAHLARGACPA